MPLYEYYCQRCDSVFEALRSLRESDEAVPCPKCGRDGERIMPTSFSAMSWNKGYAQRVPFHQKPVRNVESKRATARVKSKAGGKRRTKAAKK